MRPMSKPNRNDPCHCGSGKKYKVCHLEADEATARQARALAAAAAAAAAAPPPTDETGAPLAPMDANMPSRPLGPRFWGLAPVGLAIVVAVAWSKGVGAGLTVGAAWALGMVAWAVIRDPPPPKPRSDVPPGMNFGRSPEERQNGIIRTTTATPRRERRTRR